MWRPPGRREQRRCYLKHLPYHILAVTATSLFCLADGHCASAVIPPISKSLRGEGQRGGHLRVDGGVPGVSSLGPPGWEYSDDRVSPFLQAGRFRSIYLTCAPRAPWLMFYSGQSGGHRPVP